MRILAAAGILTLAACSGLAPSENESRPISSVTDTGSAKDAKDYKVQQSNPDPNTLKGAATPAVSASKKLEVVVVDVNLKEANGMRKVLPYLLNEDEWLILKVEQTSPTTKRYKFQRLTTPEKALTEYDPLMPKKPVKK